MSAVSPAESRLSEQRQRLLQIMRQRKDLASKALDRIGVRTEAGTPRPSYAQQRLWFLDQLAPGSPFYNVPAAIRIRTPIDPGVLRATFKEIVDRHHVLRTAFSDVDGRPFPLVLPEVDVPLKIVDLRHLPAAVREREAVRLAEEDARTPFDLHQVPLLRIGLLRLDDSDHVFLVNVHHIAADGWSMGVLTEEFRRIYEAFAVGRPCPLPPLKIQYADFASWQRRRMDGGLLQSQLDYWTTKLADLPVLDLPTELPRRAVQGFEGETLYVTLTPDLTSALKQFSRGQGVTLFVTLLAGFNALLHRYTGQDDIVIGEPIANRNRIELEPLIGFFVNSLVLRTDVSGDPTFTELLARSRDVVLEADANQDVPFEVLVERLRPERSLGRNPLFQVSLQFFSGVDVGNGQVSVPDDAIHVEKGTASLDLAFDLIESDAGLMMRVEYSTELFTRDTVVRMTAHYRNLLAAFVADPERRVSEPSMLEPAERAAVLGPWAVGPAGDPEDAGSMSSAGDAVARWAATAPDRVALEAAGREWTYGDLDESAHRLAGSLRAHGVGPESIVAICMERSADLIVSVLAVWMAGAAYLLLDPAQPEARLAYLVGDAHPHLLLTTTRQGEGTAGLGVPRIVLDDPAATATATATAATATVPIPRATGPERMAYVTYTSGSTGSPKGVVTEQGALTLHLSWMQADHPLDTDDRVLFKYAVGFDVALLEMVWPLTAGARVIVPDEGDVKDVNRLARLIRDEGVTILDVVPTMLAALLDSRVFTSARSLRRVFCGGEVMPPELLARLSDRMDVEFCNMYGPTETTITATHWPAGDRRDQARVPIGRPVGHARTYVLDRHLNPVPALVPGELHIGGRCLARGYLARPELTTERFIRDPFAGDPFARMYRTGDRCRFLPDGNLDFLGRLDDQIKVRGQRIELGELEAVLASSPLVRTGAVALGQDDQGRDQVVAYVIPQTSRPVLWPSVGEYFIYDELLYHAMTSDHVRTEAYRNAIARAVKGRTVVDIGSGADLVLARMCLEAGARRVYAIEMLDDAVRRARDLIDELGADDRLVLIHGDSRKVDLPERADVCVSELIGTIGSSEGVIDLLNDARRFLGPGGTMIPQRCVTWLSPVCLPDDLALTPRFDELATYYVDRLFERCGRRFDVRVCVKNLPTNTLLSDPAVVEDLSFTEALPTEGSTEISLSIGRDGRLDGFLLWISLGVDRVEQIDVLSAQTSWLPVFLPVFSPGIDVERGDLVTAVYSRLVDPGQMTPDYVIRGAVSRGGMTVATFDYETKRDETAYCRNPFYEALLEALPGESGPDRADDGDEESRVEDWERLYERLYDDPDPETSDRSFNAIGWNSSYTGLPLSEAEMREQVDATVERIQELGGDRILEIGCGTGLLLFRLAAHCTNYVGTDFSGAVTAQVRRQCELRDWRHVSLLQRRADDFDGFEADQFDVVVLNSVVQYFPGLDYLSRVLAGAARVVRPGGCIFVGDVRSSILREWLDAGVELARAADDVPGDELRRRVGRRSAREPELTIHPDFFPAWSASEFDDGTATVQVKRGRHPNELTKFRYDVVLRVGGGHRAAPTWGEVAWADIGDAAALAGDLGRSHPPALRVWGVPSARLAAERRLMELLRRPDVASLTAGHLRLETARAPGGVDPEDLWGAGVSAGYRVLVGWGDDAGEDGTYDAWFLGPAPDGRPWDAPATSRTALRPWKAYGQAPGPSVDANSLTSRLRTHMRRHLPESMVPTRFVRLERLPLTPNGKLDRAALPAPDRLRDDATGLYVAPRGALEAQVAAIWSEILGVERIGVDRNFFDLGGHSLLATQVVSRLSSSLGREIPLRLMFEHPTIRDVAGAIGSLPGDGDGTASPVRSSA